MIGRLLFKVIVFTLIILFFLYYQSNLDDNNTSQNSSIVSQLILQEQQIFKELDIETGQAIPYGYIFLHNLPHIEGTLVKLSQKDEQTVLAKVLVKDAYKVNVKPERVVDILYTGSINDSDAPVYDVSYIWLIQKLNNSDTNYFIQGGKHGIVQVK